MLLILKFETHPYVHIKPKKTSSVWNVKIRRRHHCQLIAPFYCTGRSTAHPSCAIMKFMHMHHTGFITSCLESLLDSVLFPDQHRRKIKQERPPGHRCCQCQLCHHGKMIVRQRCCQSRVPALKGSSACLPMTSYYLPRSRTNIYEGL